MNGMMIYRLAPAEPEGCEPLMPNYRDPIPPHPHHPVSLSLHIKSKPHKRPIEQAQDAIDHNSDISEKHVEKWHDQELEAKKKREEDDEAIRNAAADIFRVQAENWAMRYGDVTLDELP